MTAHKNVYIGLIVAAIGLILCTLLPYWVDFGTGSDDSAVGMVESLRPNIIPWANHIGIIPTDATEPLLFTCQMLIGVGLFGYCFYLLTKQKKKDSKE